MWHWISHVTVWLTLQHAGCSQGARAFHCCFKCHNFVGVCQNMDRRSSVDFLLAMSYISIEEKLKWEILISKLSDLFKTITCAISWVFAEGERTTCHQATGRYRSEISQSQGQGEGGGDFLFHSLIDKAKLYIHPCKNKVFIKQNTETLTVTTGANKPNQ